MNTTKKETETYILKNLDKLDSVTVYVTNYKLGQGKIVIECYGDAWAYYWGGMGERNLQEFFLSADNDYILNKLLTKTTQTDFDEINDMAHTKGFNDFCVTSEFEIAMQSREMDECFGSDWMMDLPTCTTVEYKYLNRILNAVKGAFSDEFKVKVR